MPKKSNTTRPLVSVCLPVYNGSKLIGRSIESILAQTYDNIELLICDNASTDNTAEICKEYAQKDSRIRFYQNETNIGVFNNSNKLVSLAKGEYLLGQAHDDVRHPDFIKKCLGKLLAAPNAIVCMSDFIEVSVNGDEKYVSLESTLGGPAQRVINWFHGYEKKEGHFQFGLYRTKELKKLGPAPDTYGGDWIMIAKQLLAGEFVAVNEPLWYIYIHPKPGSPLKYWMPHKKDDSSVKLFTIFYQTIFNVINDSEQLTPSEKEMVFQEAVKSMVIHTITYNYLAYCRILAENIGRIDWRQFQHSGNFAGEAFFKALEAIFSKILNVPHNNQDVDLKDKSLNEIYEAYLQKYNNESTEKKPIFIWGAGREADAVKMFKNAKYKVDGIVSADTEQQDKCLSGIKIYPPSKIFNWQGSKRPFIVIASQEDTVVSIHEELEKNGYIKGRDFGSYNFFHGDNFPIIRLKTIAILERSNFGNEVLTKIYILRYHWFFLRSKMKLKLRQYSRFLRG